MTRLLPPQDWPKLDGTVLEHAWPYLDITTDKVVSVEDESGAIIGCCCLHLQWHLEGVWIAPAYRRKVSVGRRLLKTVRQLFGALHVRDVYMMARSPQGSDICQRLGDALKLDCEHFIVRVQ